MMELADTRPPIEVAEAEYLRLLGYPRGHVMEGRAADLAAETREWYAHNGQPWVYARDTGAVELAGSAVRIAGAAFHCDRLRRTFEEAEAYGAVLAAVSAGPEAEQHAQELWREEKPDEYFFLETYASAVTEYLVTMLGARLCAWAEAQGTAVLPHYSPGYTGWDVAEQPRLLSLANGEFPGPLETLDSGALRPKKSLLAVFGITCNPHSLLRLTGGVPCVSCAFHPCQFRRAPYARSKPAEREPLYTVNGTALERWAARRLRLETRADGTIHARFRYDGTTCVNMGRPLAFNYSVTLGPKEAGYPLLEQRCAPAENDTGHRSMCEYITDPEALMEAIDREKPLAGRPLADVFQWIRPSSPAGCYCDAASRDHKWRLVLETIHYALNRKPPE